MRALLIALALQVAAPAPEPAPAPPAPADAPAPPAVVPPNATRPAARPGTRKPGIDLSDRRHVRALYFDLVGRSPKQDELETAATPGASADTLARHLIRTREFWEQWYEDELFFFLLIDNARPDDVAGAQSIPWRLNAGQLDLPGAVTEIVSGAAFNRANPGNDTFVSVVLEQLLGVDVQRQHAVLEAGKKMYDGKTATLYGESGDSQADVVRIASHQPAFARRLVERQYQRIVGRDAAPKDLERWAAAVREQPAAFLDVVQEWVLSPPYAERLATLRGKTDLQFIRSLYVDLTDELPEPTELRRLRGALSTVGDSAPLRAVIARSLLDSRAQALPAKAQLLPEAFVDSSFLRFLGRLPARAERAEFLAVFAEEDCQPATLLRALVTHPEYQTY